MSPWPCRSLVATLCPDQVSVVQECSSLTRHGFARTVEWQHVLGVGVEPEAPAWRAALETLACALPGRTRAITAATAVLSNRFLCYALVPSLPDLLGPAEQLAYARHRFATVHGAAAGAWDVRVSRCGSDAAALASAVDRQLLSGLEDLFHRAGVRLVSIQPRLMAAANGLRRRVPAGDAWLALVEPGHLCLALLQGGQWRRLRTMRHDSPWQEQLRVALDRESFQAGGAALPGDVYVWHARERLEALPDTGGWRLHAVDTRRGADPSAPTEANEEAP